MLIRDDCFLIEEDRDNFDYVYTIRDLVVLPGKRYDGKRNFIKRFKQGYVYGYVTITKSNVDDCLAFEEAWCSAKDCKNNPGLAYERIAFEEIIKHVASFDLIGAMIRVGAKVAGLAIAQELAPETLVLHVLKAGPAFIGSYQVMCNEFLAREAAAYRYVNFDQDLGVAGLRKFKLSYHPDRLVKKFIVCGVYS